jgi:hypothetical protein
MSKAKKTEQPAQITLEDLKSLRTQLETEAVEKQKELAEKTYAIDFESISNITKVLNHLNKDVSWSAKNAALLVNLHDSLKDEKLRLLAQESVVKSERREAVAGEISTAYLKQVDINTLYQSLLAVQSTGVESARNYTRLLTNIGRQITEAMQAMAESNKVIQSLHVELAELDGKIQQEEVPQPEVEQPEATTAPEVVAESVEATETK